MYWRRRAVSAVLGAAQGYGLSALLLGDKWQGYPGWLRVASAIVVLVVAMNGGRLIARAVWWACERYGWLP